MKNSTIRLNKINKLIQKNLSIILNNKLLNIKNNLITITKVVTKSDLSHTQIFISMLTNTKTTLNILNNSSKKLKHYLSTKLTLHKMPSLTFIIDTKTIELKNLYKLIESTKKQK